MNPTIKNDIISVLNDSIKAIERKEYQDLASISNHTIHDASIFQDEDSLTLAVSIFAISKIIYRCNEKGASCPDSLIISMLKSAKNSLEIDLIKKYRKEMGTLLKSIERIDSKLKMYIQEVIDKAKIKKASKIHEHGVSLARTSELLGIDRWELQNYIGKTVTEIPKGISIEPRLKKARELFK